MLRKLGVPSSLAIRIAARLGSHQRTLSDAGDSWGRECSLDFQGHLELAYEQGCISYGASRRFDVGDLGEGAAHNISTTKDSAVVSLSLSFCVCVCVCVCLLFLSVHVCVFVRVCVCVP